MRAADQAAASARLQNAYAITGGAVMNRVKLDANETAIQIARRRKG